jgi:hypothetical protein
MSRRLRLQCRRLPRQPGQHSCDLYRPPLADASRRADGTPLERHSDTLLARDACRPQLGPPDLPPRPLMVADFAIIGSLVQPGRPRIRFLSIGPRLCSTLPSDPASRRQASDGGIVTRQGCRFQPAPNVFVERALKRRPSDRWVGDGGCTDRRGLGLRLVCLTACPVAFGERIITRTVHTKHLNTVSCVN